MDEERPPRPPKEPNEEPSTSSLFGSSMGEAAPYLGLGIEIMVSMLFFVVLGYFADRWLGTSPWLLIVGALLSFVATGVTLYRTVQEMDARAAARRKGPEVKGDRER